MKSMKAISGSRHPQIHSRPLFPFALVLLLSLFFALAGGCFLRDPPILSPYGLPIWVVAFSRDFQMTVIGTRDGTVTLTNTGTGKVQATIASEVAITSFAFPVPESTLAFGDHNGNITLLDVAMGQERLSIVHQFVLLKELDKGMITSLAFSPDHNMLASASEDYSLKFWDTETGQELMPLKGDLPRTRFLLFSPNGKTLACESRVSAIELWDMTTGERKHSVKVPGGLTGKAFSPDGSTIAVGRGNNRIELWDVATGQRKAVLGVSEDQISFIQPYISFIQYSPDGRMLAAVISDGTAVSNLKCNRGSEK